MLSSTEKCLNISLHASSTVSLHIPILREGIKRRNDPSWKKVKMTFIYLFVWLGGYATYRGRQAEVRGQLLGIGFLLPPTQAIKNGGKSLYPLSHLTALRPQSRAIIHVGQKKSNHSYKGSIEIWLTLCLLVSSMWKEDKLGLGGSKVLVNGS